MAECGRGEQLCRSFPMKPVRHTMRARLTTRVSAATRMLSVLADAAVTCRQEKLNASRFRRIS